MRPFSEYTTNRLGFLEIVVNLADLQSSFICSRNDGVVRSRQYVACYRAASESIVNMVDECVHEPRPNEVFMLN